MTPVTLAELNELANADPQNPRVDISEATADELFADIGMDSFATIELLDRVEQRYGVAVPDDDVKAIATPRHLLKYLAERRGDV
jgi:act minimal PKS acyl carrier protein